MNGWVYFIQSSRGGPIKIGWTSASVEDRLRSLQTSAPDKLVVLATAAGSRLDEKELHRELSSYRMRGEWFADCSEVRDVINRFTASGDRLRIHVKMLRCGCIPGFHFCADAAAAWRRVGLALLRGDKHSYAAALRSFEAHKPESEESVRDRKERESRRRAA